MRIQDYKAATAKLKEFSEFYEANRYKSWLEHIEQENIKRLTEMQDNFERIFWGDPAIRKEIKGCYSPEEFRKQILGEFQG